MKRKTNYCQFCGNPVKPMAIILGALLDNVCDEPTCPAHGDEIEREIQDQEDALIAYLDGETDDYET